MVNGPKPKFNMSKKMNKQEKRLGKLAAFCGLINKECVYVVDGLSQFGKTKEVSEFLKLCGKTQRKKSNTLIISGQDVHTGAYCSLPSGGNNIDGVRTVYFDLLNIYELSIAHRIVLDKLACDKLDKLLSNLKGHNLQLTEV